MDRVEDGFRRSSQRKRCSEPVAISCGNFKINTKPPPATTTPRIKIMSTNVLWQKKSRKTVNIKEENVGEKGERIKTTSKWNVEKAKSTQAREKGKKKPT
jgi:hypothetical protein